MKIRLPQQSCNLLRAALNAPGWAKSPKEIYLAGKSLAETVAEADITWIKSNEELLRLSPEEIALYRCKDKAWCNQELELEMSDAEYQNCHHCLEVLAGLGQIPPSKFAFHLFAAFGHKFD